MNWIAELQNLGLVVTAGGLGAVIGLEREIHDKPAGLRTHIFVSAASALLVVLADSMVHTFGQHSAEVTRADPTRIVQAIVVGISFLGAGTILHHGGNRVEGLTTAASILLTAVVGIAVALEHLVLAAGTTLFAVLVLALLGRVQQHFKADDATPSDLAR